MYIIRKANQGLPAHTYLYSYGQSLYAPARRRMAPYLPYPSSISPRISLSMNHHSDICLQVCMSTRLLKC